MSLISGWDEGRESALILGHPSLPLLIRLVAPRILTAKLQRAHATLSGAVRANFARPPTIGLSARLVSVSSRRGQTHPEAHVSPPPTSRISAGHVVLASLRAQRLVSYTDICA